MTFDTTQNDRGAPSEADLQRIGKAKSHREAYPEQYRHPRCGQLVRVMHQGREAVRGRIERVVGSQYGQMAKLDTDPADTFRLLSTCEDAS